MKVCGFTFVRNAIKFDYPVVESILSILPVCDKLIVNVGKSDDETLKLIQSIDNEKITIINSVWDDSLKKNGEVLAVETNKALDAIPDGYDWAFYLQADELVHEKFLPAISAEMQRHKDNPAVEGLLFNYTHFYGTFAYVADSRSWYRHEIRIVRPQASIRSYRDAQGFRKNGEKLKVKPANASIYHYGWVRNPLKMKQKEQYFHSLWHSNEWIESNTDDEEFFDYSKIDSVKLFEGSHPEVMKKRVATQTWNVSPDFTKKKFSLKNKLLYWIEKYLGIRPFEYKNYQLLK